MAEWWRGRRGIGVAATLVLALPALFFGWGLIIMLESTAPPVRGLELICLAAYVAISQSTWPTMPWVDSQAARRLVPPAVAALIGRCVLVAVMVAGLGFAIAYLPPAYLPYAQTFGLDMQEIPISYGVHVLCTILFLGFIADIAGNVAGPWAIAPTALVALLIWTLYDPGNVFAIGADLSPTPTLLATTGAMFILAGVLCAVTAGGARPVVRRIMRTG